MWCCPCKAGACSGGACRSRADGCCHPRVLPRGWRSADLGHTFDWQPRTRRLSIHGHAAHPLNRSSLHAFDPTPPPSCRRRRCCGGTHAHRVVGPGRRGAGLAQQAGAHRRSLRPRRYHRHPGPVRSRPSWARRSGQTFIVDNKPGAGGNLGADLVAKSAADGYTLLMGTVGTQSINAVALPQDALRPGARTSRPSPWWPACPTCW